MLILKLEVDVPDPLPHGQPLGEKNFILYKYSEAESLASPA
jgi:hypothetical protein